jgi:ornithine carbamoyltransferase
MWQRFTERARRVVSFAQEEAERLGENPVGTAHLLLGLIRERDSVSARVLERLGISLDRVRMELEQRANPRDTAPGEERPLSPRSERVIELAYDEARRLHNNYVGTEHLLLALIGEGEGVAARILESLGASLERTRRELAAMQESDAELAAFTQTLRERLKRLAPGMESMEAPIGSEINPDQDTPGKALRWLAGQAVKCRSASTAFEASRVGTELARAACQGLTDLCRITDLNREQASALLSLARVLKDTSRVGATVHREILAGKTLAMIFEKPSLRTRVSFETGMFQLGGHALYLQPSDIGLGKREPVADVARVLGRMVDGIMARVFAHSTVVELAQYSKVPVINGLCDLEHPCQALADFLTLWEERGDVEGQKIAYVGDGNNVAHSLALLGTLLGAHVVIAGPEGYEPDPNVIEVARANAEQSGGSVTVIRDAREACKDADAVYTDVWASMGQEDEAAERARVFADYQVTEELFSLAKSEAIFLHCLPAHRGEEAVAEVVDHPRSAIWRQAENRLHAQKAVLAVLLG